MSVEYQSKQGALTASAVNIEKILQLSSDVEIGAPIKCGRRARKRRMQATAAKSGLLAPLLAAEGCKTIGKDDIDLGRGAGAGGPASGGVNAGGGASGGASAGGPASDGDSAGGAVSVPPATGSAQNDFFSGETNQIIELTVDDILANDDMVSGGSLELVRVFDAVNGTVFFDGAIVQFVPAEDFAGNAHFSYEVRDENGELHIARVDFQIIGEADNGDDQGDDHGDHSGGACASRRSIQSR